VLPATILSGCSCHTQDSLTYSQHEVGIGFNVVRAEDATVDGAHMVEPIRVPYRANTQLKASTDARHALIEARGMHAALPTMHVELSWLITTVPPVDPAPRYCHLMLSSDVGS